MIEEKEFEEKDEQQVFQGFTLKELYKQIVDNSRKNREQLLQVINDISLQISNVVDFQLLSPQMSSYMNLLVKNDQVLLKLANSLTKINQSRKQLQQASLQGQLSQEQKKQIIDKVQKEVNPVFLELKGKVKSK